MGAGLTVAAGWRIMDGRGGALDFASTRPTPGRRNDAECSCLSIIPAWRAQCLMSDFSKSLEAAFRRVFRLAVKQSTLTRTEKEITTVILNLWLHHRNGPGFIHPSKAMLARLAKCSRSSVVNCLRFLKASDVLIVISDAHGGRRRAPHYVVNLGQLAVLCGTDMPIEFEGILEEFKGRQKGANVDGKLHPLRVRKLHPVYSTRSDVSDLENTDCDDADEASSKSVLWMNGKGFGNA